MLETTNKLINRMNQFMDKAKAEIKVEDVLTMDQNSREALGLALDMYQDACELARKNAEVIERLDKTTQELLETNKKLLETNKKLLEKAKDL